MTLSLDDRSRLLDKITGWPGLGATPAHSLEQRRAYAQIAMPNDPEPTALASLPTMSGCLLVAMGWLRAAGVRHPLLDAPYQIGQACPWLTKIARDLGALRDPKDGCNPLPGDVIVIGAEIHGFIVTSYTALDGKMTSIDGGQGARGAAIEWRERRFGWNESTQKYWTWEGPNLDRRGRYVVEWIDLGAMLP